ncbi:MAG TPA: ATP synthase subunit I [Syntrophales bacterium]|nr:ATP synthase subunit I [Syntrophales bacterium]HOM07821.1 ATP synthase subunit I [Syntrophales bacterium]HOO00545.1 ATP synthase subunit I [Syntrophales bacterium]HPC01849.1 ATP synthase subunit I [Syntrophales bacterium]HPQ07355.1 ATP synthase subunit I [Syntrophales bacterium]
MSGIPDLILMPFALGAAAGGAYFSGLWWTVRRLPSAAHPWRLLALSYLTRVSLALGCFYMIMDGSWERILSAVLGFMAARAVLTRLWGRAPAGTVLEKG